MMKNIIGLFIFVFMLNSCAVKNISKVSYTETIDSFLVSKDATVLFVIGKKYHYKIDLNNQLQNILLSKNKKYLKTYFQNFEIDKLNNIDGVCKIKYDEKQNKIPYKWLIKNSFEKEHSKYYKSSLHTAIFDISGKRYIAKYIPAKYKFNKNYQIDIKEEPSIVDNLLTPLVTVKDIIMFTGVSLIMLANEITK
jgi:hypothetical protein